jgi:hypothetical protein
MGIAPAWCVLASGFDRESSIAPILVLLAVFLCLPAAGDKGIYQHLSDCKQIAVKIRAGGFLHWSEMICAVEDIIASGLRA